MLSFGSMGNPKRFWIVMNPKAAAFPMNLFSRIFSRKKDGKTHSEHTSNEKYKQASLAIDNCRFQLFEAESFLVEAAELATARAQAHQKFRKSGHIADNQLEQQEWANAIKATIQRGQLAMVRSDYVFASYLFEEAALLARQSYSGEGACPSYIQAKVDLYRTLSTAVKALESDRELLEWESARRQAKLEQFVFLP